jgi:hypothetical protein
MGSVTLNLGLRFEREAWEPLVNPGVEVPDLGFGFGDKIAPRLGVAWDVRGDGTWKLYANGGLFYDTVKHGLLRNGFGGGAFKLYYYTLDTYDWTSLSWQGALESGRLIFPLDFRPGAATVDPDLKPTYTSEFAIGTDLQLGPEVALGVQYLHRGLHQMIEDFQVPGDPTNYVGNAGMGLVAELPAPVPWPKFKRNYDGLEVTLRKRMSDNWTASLNYTFSRLWGNYDGLADPGDRSLSVGANPNQGRYCTYIEGCYTSQGTADEGRLFADVPHQLKLHGSYTFPLGLTLGGYFTAKSGLPVSRAIGVNSAAYTFPEGRLTDGRTDALTQVDLYLQWGFNLGESTRLSVTANVINVFDQAASTHVANHMLLGGSTAIRVPQDTYFAGYDYEAVIEQQNATRDPRFLMADWFQFPRELRLGVRLDF